MRLSTACLLTTAAVIAAAAPAFAQTEAPAAAAPAPAAEAQPAAPAAPAGAAQVQTNAAPGSQDAAAAQAAAAAASRELPPTLPTSGDGAVITGLLTNVCQPLVNGGDLVALAKAQKIKLDRRSGQYIVPLGKKPYQVAILPSGANPNVCELRVQYEVGADQPIVDGLNVWRFLHQPQMVLHRNDIANYDDVQRVTTTWDNFANQMIDGKFHGLVISQLNKLDGSPSVNAKYDEAIIQYMVRPPVRPMISETGQRTTADAVAAQQAAAAAQAAQQQQQQPAAPADGTAPAQ